MNTSLPADTDYEDSVRKKVKRLGELHAEIEILSGGPQYDEVKIRVDNLIKKYGPTTVTVMDTRVLSELIVSMILNPHHFLASDPEKHLPYAAFDANRTITDIYEKGGMTGRLYNILINLFGDRSKAPTVYELSLVPFNTLMNLRNMGTRSMKEIQEICRVFGIPRKNDGRI